MIMRKLEGNPESEQGRFLYFDLEYDSTHSKKVPRRTHMQIAMKHFRKHSQPKASNPLAQAEPSKSPQKQITQESYHQQQPSTKRLTLKELNQMGREVSELIRTDFNPPSRNAARRGEQQMYRKYQKCSFFDREAIYRPRNTKKRENCSFRPPKKVKEAETLEPDNSVVDESTLDHQEAVPVSSGNVSSYLPIVLKTSPKTASRFDLILKQKIRARILEDVKQYNTPNIRKDIRLSTLNSESLWIDQFEDLKQKLVQLEKKKESSYRRSIGSRSYDPYRQFMALPACEKHLVKNSYLSTRKSSKPF